MVDNFSSLMASFAFTDISLIKFYEDKISRFYEVVNKQTDRQTDKRRLKHNFFGASNE